jgi:hypothetical protein
MSEKSSIISQKHVKCTPWSKVVSTSSHGEQKPSLRNNKEMQKMSTAHRSKMQNKLTFKLTFKA